MADGHDDLERRLRAAAASMVTPVPAVDGLVDRLVRRIAIDSVSDRSRPIGRRIAGDSPAMRAPAAWGRGRRIVAVAAAVLTIAAAVVVGSPGARRAVAGLLGLRGVSITRPTPSTAGPASAGSTTTTTTAPTTPADLAGLDLGTAVTLGDARAASAFAVQVLAPTDVGAPIAVFRRIPPAGGMVTVAYRAGERLVLLSQFTGATAPFIGKALSEGTTLTPVQVGTSPGYWISGTPHRLLYQAPDGTVIDDTVRLAGNTLLWDIGTQTYRLEGAPDLSTAMSWAGRLAPAT